jgi:hypothetical protein
MLKLRTMDSCNQYKKEETNGRNRILRKMQGEEINEG